MCIMDMCLERLVGRIYIDCTHAKSGEALEQPRDDLGTMFRRERPWNHVGIGSGMKQNNP